MQLQNEIDSLGSSNIQIRNWKEEADECWALSTQNAPLTTILEIGLFESSQRLALDARGWLETSGTSVQMAFTLYICRSIPQIIIKHYELSFRQCSIESRASPSSASCVETVSITRQNNTTNVSGDLRIPFRKFTNRNISPNNQLERDLFTPGHKLQRLGEKVWRLQGFI
ncbi:hypothetical protein BDW59DRAFT_149683 [Aspergillus cavernicola]|uniref:Uncharacterized protein n=1 Tax=Aspergillus cavernicola TaxID=176166 RepID=A0ABR4I4D0_9EURO